MLSTDAEKAKGARRRKHLNQLEIALMVSQLVIALQYAAKAQWETAFWVVVATLFLAQIRSWRKLARENLQYCQNMVDAWEKYRDAQLVVEATIEKPEKTAH